VRLKALSNAFAFVCFVPNFALEQVSNEYALPREVVSNSQGVLVFVAFRGAKEEYSAGFGVLESLHDEFKWLYGSFDNQLFEQIFK